MGRGAASALAALLACTACGGSPARPTNDREWVANAHGAIVQLREDVIAAAGIDPRRAVRDDASLYSALVVFTDFGGCRHMVGALGGTPARYARVEARLDRACAALQRAAALFTAAVRDTDVTTMRAAIETAQQAFAPLDQAELRLRGQ